MNKSLQYITIDDDDINNMVSRHIIRQTLGKETDIVAFTSALIGIDFIKSSYSESPDFRQILLLDINMPEVDGWQALSMLEDLEPDIKKRLVVFMLSSSMDPGDLGRAAANQIVCGYIEKPLTPEKLLSTLAANLKCY